MSPSKQHERWRISLLGDLKRRLSGCIWCGFGLRRQHPPTCHIPARTAVSPWQYVTWQCDQLHAHTYDLLHGAHQVVGERLQSAPSGKRCRPDITILDAASRPLSFIEVVHTHLSERAIEVAKEIDIPLFVVPAPDGNVVHPALGAAAPWWEHVPDFPDRDLMQASERFTQMRTAQAASEMEWFAEHEVVEDENGNVVWSRFRGSVPDLDNMAYPAIGTALVADSCTWTCARAAAALKAQDS